MDNNLIFNVNIDILLKTGISINQYLFLLFVKYKKKNLMVDYQELANFPPLIDKNQVKYLIKEKYLERIDNKFKLVETEDGNFKEEYIDKFDNYRVTDNFNNILNVKCEDVIEELKSIYPKRTPSGSRVNLHQDSTKWIPKYLQLVKNDRVLHDKIIKCIKLEKKERQRKDTGEYWALLTTYINNKRWEVYLDELDKDPNEEFISFSRDI